jgi:hypothetical protein
VSEPIIILSKHRIRLHPLPSGQCRLEIDATVSWDAAIDALKALGFVGKASMEQMYGDRT